MNTRHAITFAILIITPGCTPPWQKPVEFVTQSNGIWIDGCKVLYNEKPIIFGSTYDQVTAILGEPEEDPRNESPDGRKHYIFWNQLGLGAHFSEKSQRLVQINVYYELKYDTKFGDDIFPAETDYEKKLHEENLSHRPKVHFKKDLVFEGAKIPMVFNHNDINDIRAEFHRKTKGNLNAYKPIEYHDHIFGEFLVRNECGGGQHLALDFSAYNRPKPYELEQVSIYAQGLKD